MDFLLLPAIGHQILDYLPVHQRLAAEEIHLQIMPVSGIGNQKIQSLLSCLIAHQRPASVVFSFLRKAVAAGQIAVMGDMKAQCFYHCGTLFEINDLVLIGIFREKRSLVFQHLHIIQHFPDILFRPSVLQLCHDILRSAVLIQAYHLIGQLIHHMNSSAVHIQNNVVTVVIIAMYHFRTPYVYKNKILSVSFSLPGPLLLPGCAGAGSATPEQGCLKSHETCAFETSLFFTLLSYDSYL